MSPPLAPGRRLDRYELVREVARGGMGRVWLARQLGKHGFERQVALKTLLPQHAGEERFRTMFLDEARIASRIDHPNVVRILDLGETDDDVLYLVMDWVRGITLERLARATWERDGAFPLPVALRIVADACLGLRAAHELRDDGRPLGIVHRDVSPENLLISDGGVATLIDFGIARARDRLAAETAVGQLKGKPGYIAPEQAMRKAVDRRVDVWAAGAVLFRLLVGEPPFRDLDALADFIGGVRPVPEMRAVPAAVVGCVARALAVLPQERFASAGELADAVLALGRDFGIADAEEIAAMVEHAAALAAEQTEDAEPTDPMSSVDTTLPAVTRHDAPSSRRR